MLFSKRIVNDVFEKQSYKKLSLIIFIKTIVFKKRLFFVQKHEGCFQKRQFFYENEIFLKKIEKHFFQTRLTTLLFTLYLMYSSED